MKNTGTLAIRQMLGHCCIEVQPGVKGSGTVKRADWTRTDGTMDAAQLPQVDLSATKAHYLDIAYLVG
jgi:hypothetical protein